MTRSSSRRHRDERGAAAIMVALSMTAVVVACAMVVDFGLVRVDRHVDKSAADSATLAGLHALGQGDGTAHPYRGVCTALQFLRQNDARFSGVTSGSGTWTSATGVPKADGCTTAALTAATCIPGDTTTWARFVWSGNFAGKPVTVTIQSGYDLGPSPTADPSGYWPEDALPAASADSVDEAQGCDQLAVQVTQARHPGLGSLATSADLQTSIRSVGRVQLGDGGYAPAMLLLKRTGCPVLQSGSNSGVSFIHVLGALSSNGDSQPGSIHSDSDGLGGCTGGSNQNIFLGKGAAGIVAYAAPLASNPAMPDSTKPGEISSVAGNHGMAASIQRDSLANVYGSTALSSGGTAVEPKGRDIVTRAPVDERYRATARSAMLAATDVFAAGPSGWTALNQCNPTQAQVNALSLNASSKLYVDCTTNAGFVPNGALSIPAGTVLFTGKVNPSAALALPNAQHVYVAGKSGTGIALNGSSTAFSMNTSLNTDAVTGRCSTARNTSKAVLFVKDGVISEANSSSLRLCKTTVFLMGGQPDGCVPTTDGTPPTSTPCAGALGTGRINQSGGDIDWTAPDQYDVMKLSDGHWDPAKTPAWKDQNGPEDLALWAESGSSSSSLFSMGGGGAFNVRGVFMAPNADAFTIGGNSSMTLTNAQFIASTIALNGTNTNITMSVDANAAVALPDLKVVGLVR